MKKIISLCLALLPLGVTAQSTDSIIQQIRFEYQTIIANKEKYKRVVINVPPQELFPYDGEGDDPDLSMKITYYIDNNKIKLISILNTWSHWIYREEIIEYYLKNDQVFFIYQQLNDIPQESDISDDNPIRVTEDRIYYESNKCVKHLIKRMEGKDSEEVEKLLWKAPNIENDCEFVDIQSKIHTDNQENINTLFERYRKYEKDKK